jgi:aminoglycoside/choline kinase family phosphotransferase
MTAFNDGSAAADDPRKLAGARWAARTVGKDTVRLVPVSGDASFRRYFRFRANGQSVILMDACARRA